MHFHDGFYKKKTKRTPARNLSRRGFTHNEMIYKYLFVFNDETQRKFFLQLYVPYQLHPDTDPRTISFIETNQQIFA